MEGMRVATRDEIEIALTKLKKKLTTYLWLQRRVRSCDLGKDEEFQRHFSGFYKVRRNSQWRSVYFGVLESSKVKGIDFPEALKEINRLTGRIEASFASKLVATLDPSKPVIDKFVMQHFELRLPRWGSSDREAKTMDLYYDLCDKYHTFIQSPTGKMIQELFESRYPNPDISELKKIDLVLWQIRPY
jgi:hypothetical protein